MRYGGGGIAAFYTAQTVCPAHSPRKHTVSRVLRNIKQPFKFPIAGYRRMAAPHRKRIGHHAYAMQYALLAYRRMAYIRTLAVCVIPRGL
jgi:hypothetical protein